MDTDGSFDTTNHRFRPAKAGYYEISINPLITQQTGSASLALFLQLEKNGGPIPLEQTYQLINDTSSSYSQTLHVDGIVQLNGTTDYIEGYFDTNTGNISSSAGSNLTFMTASYLHE